MKTLETFVLSQISLKRQKIKEHLEGKLILRDNSIRFIMKFWAYELKPEVGDDEMMLENDDNWELVYTAFDISAKKGAISGTELWYVPEGEIWRLTIYVNGFGQDLRIYYQDKAEAHTMTAKLNQYLFGKQE